MKPIRIGMMLLALIVILAAAALADDPVTSTAPITPAKTDTLSASPTTGLTESVLPSITRLGLSLLAIVVIIYATVFLMKKLSGNKIGRGRTIQIIEQTYLAPKKSVCLLKLADRVVLVGITENNINMLTELDCESMPADYLNKLKEQQTGFQGYLNNAAGKLFGKKNGGGSDATPL
jgi:flagellar biosynthetic protein FliO